MAHIHPFRAFRPVKEEISVLTALPYDVYNVHEAREAVKQAPRSFLAVDRPEAHFPEGTDIYAPEVYEKASVLYHVKPGLPKFMFLHGTEDKLSPIELVDPLYEKLQETGNYVEYYVFPGVEHGDDRLYQPETKDMVIDFLNRNM